MITNRPEWETNFNNLEHKVFLQSKFNPLPTERDIFVAFWEAVTPKIIEFINLFFVEKIKLCKDCKEKNK